MTSLHAGRRSAERFDSLVSDTTPSTGVDARTAELLELVGALRTVPAATPRPGFVSSLRERLVLAAETELVAGPATPASDLTRKLTVAPRTKARHERRLGVALGALAIVGASTSMAVASQGAIPGDTLYPIKRAIESTEAGFSVSDQSKGEALLGNASGRLQEVGQLTQGDHPDGTLVADTLATFSSQADQASQLLVSDYQDHGHQASINKLLAFTSTSVTTLAGLEGSVPDSAHDALIDAAQTLFAIDSSARQVCPDCSGEGITELPADLLAAGAAAAQQVVPAVPTASATPGTGNGKGGVVSGLEPPSDPVKVDPSAFPTALPTPPLPLPTSGLPTSVPTTAAPADPTRSASSGTSTKTPKVDASNPIGLTPVTDPVTTIVDGVVQTVTGVVGGLVGGLLGTDASGNPTGGGLLGGGKQP